jgi:restriction system protein
MMAIPDYQVFMLPLLRRSAEGPASIARLAQLVADDLRLTPDERLQTTPGGGKTLLADRAGWAKTYMKQAGLLCQPKRGVVEITDAGLKLLTQQPVAINNATLRQYPSFLEFLRRKRAGGGGDAAVDAVNTETAALPEDTPDQRILTAHTEIETLLRADLLAAIKHKAASFFEKVVLDLLGALGYGLPGETSSLRTGRSGDGGIDGVIDEDRLGLERIYVQAKRYTDQTVSAHDVRSFAGALEDKGARKGVFVTTSTFSRDAISYAERQQHKRIVLIDGDRLADLMIRHGVGVRVERAVEIKKIDLDYFEPDDA